MKTTAFLMLYAGALITLGNRVLASVSGERGEKWKAKGEEVPPPSQSFPLLTLPSFPSFSLPALNFPYLQAFSQPNRMSSPERVRATKTEYVEVTRRQTVHPVCYTAYEARAPCLPYAQSDFQEYDYDNSDVDAVHQIHDSFNLNEVKNLQESVPKETENEKNSEDSTRSGKYLEVKLRRNGGVETSTKIEGSEMFPIFNRVPVQQRTTEYQTKTVLITKLEKYTDRRVTATLLAVNCLPVDRSIPMCQNYPNPIRETPDRRSDDEINYQPADYRPTSAINTEVENSPPNTNLKSEPALGSSSAKTGSNVFEPEYDNTEDTLLAEE